MLFLSKPAEEFTFRRLSISREGERERELSRVCNCFSDVSLAKGGRKQAGKQANKQGRKQNSLPSSSAIPSTTTASQVVVPRVAKRF